MIAAITDTVLASRRAARAGAAAQAEWNFVLARSFLAASADVAAAPLSIGLRSCRRWLVQEGPQAPMCTGQRERRAVPDSHPDGSPPKNWVINGIAPEDRDTAVAAADREGLSIAEWLSRAIRLQAMADRQPGRTPVTVPPPSGPAAGGTDLAAIERMIAAAVSLAGVTGEPPPRQLQRLAYGLLREQMKALKDTRQAPAAVNPGADSQDGQKTNGDGNPRRGVAAIPPASPPG